MKKYYISLICLLCCVNLFPQTASSNYVMTTTKAADDRSVIQIDYHDGLGRISQSLMKAFTPSGYDFVTLHEYDLLGRDSVLWNPTPLQQSSGDMPGVNTVRSIARNYYADTHPFSTALYDSHPVQRIRESSGQGRQWYDNKKSVKIEYITNDDVVCLEYAIASDNVSLLCKGQYDGGSLKVTKATDEDGNISYSFTDFFGHEILTRQMNGSMAHDTYYVYDDYGNLRYVLPPLASDAVSGVGTYSMGNNTALQQYAYYYEYDSRNRCVKKKLPGCEACAMKYDHAGRVVFTQDGVQGTKGQWSFFLYDQFGRLAVTGIHQGTSVPAIGHLTVVATYTGSGSYGGYTANLSVDTDKLLIVNYYDTYDFTSTDSQLQYSSSGYGTQYTNGTAGARGLLTGTRKYILQNTGSSGYTTEAYYYDLAGNIVQSHATNHLSGYDHYYSSFSLTGKPLQTRHEHTAPDMASFTETVTYSYDHADRLTSIKHKLDNNQEVTIATYAYEEAGRLRSKSMMGAASITYDYNVRNNIEQVASSAFTEKLYYCDSRTGSTPRYNGNASAVDWSVGGLERGYNFFYDGLSRITRADYMEGTARSTKYDVAYSYDKMGNILTLRRKGKLDSGGYDYIDDLVCSYDGNQLIKADDEVAGPIYNGAFHFNDGAAADQEYEYDENGNMTKDLNRKISLIEYNSLNLPSHITIPLDMSIHYGYLADGTKLHVAYIKGLEIEDDYFSVADMADMIKPNNVRPPLFTITQYDYCGNTVYRNNTLEKILIDGGYISMTAASPTYHFYLQDHLGNNRVVVSQSGTVEQVNHYYPYGGLMGDISTEQDVQRYKYNGKELDRMYGLDWYDYGARHYDGVLGRWHVMDPLCEKYYSVSPYAYCHGNPINRFDPNGMYDFRGTIQSNRNYNVIVVLPSNYQHDKTKALLKDYYYAKKNNVPIILVDNIKDFVNAMEALKKMNSKTNAYTINSHGYIGSNNGTAKFYIGNDKVTENTDFIPLEEGLKNRIVFIGACEVGSPNGYGYELIEKMAKQTKSTVIASSHVIYAGYKYNGSLDLNAMKIPYESFPNYNDYIISEKGGYFEMIKNVRIDKNWGVKWDYNPKITYPYLKYGGGSYGEDY